MNHYSFLKFLGQRWRSLLYHMNVQATTQWKTTVQWIHTLERKQACVILLQLLLHVHTYTPPSLSAHGVRDSHRQAWNSEFGNIRAEKNTQYSPPFSTMASSGASDCQKKSLTMAVQSHTYWSYFLCWPKYMERTSWQVLHEERWGHFPCMATTHPLTLVLPRSQYSLAL